MQGPKPPTIELTASDRQALEALTRRPSTPQQIAFRARIMLACADGFNNAQVARQLDTSVNTVRHWRTRWLGLEPLSRNDLSVAERLEDAPRPGAPTHFTAEEVSQIVALACEPPQAAKRPISQWTGREIADEIVKRGIVERISTRHAARLLKRGLSSPTASATG